MKITDLTNNQCVHCPTEEDAKKLCEIMHNAGLRWCTGQSYLQNTKWNKIQNTYYPKEGTYSRIEFFQKEGFEIFTLEDIDEVLEVRVKTVTTYEIFGREFGTLSDAEAFKDYIVRLFGAKTLQDVADIVSMG